MIRNIAILGLDLYEFIVDCRKRNKVHDTASQSGGKRKQQREVSSRRSQVVELDEDFISRRSQNFLNALRSNKVANIFDPLE